MLVNPLSGSCICMYVDKQDTGYSLSLCYIIRHNNVIISEKCNELAVGTVAGHLLIYKGSEPRAWKSCKDLGMVSPSSVSEGLVTWGFHLV